MFERRRSAGKIVQLPVEDIHPSPYQARTTFDEQELAGLAQSIRENGLLQPITVRKTDSGYELVAGERRLRACKLAKMGTIPSIVCNFTDHRTAALGLLENLQRADLNPFEQAQGLRDVMVLWDCTQAEAAKRLGMAQPNARATDLYIDQLLNETSQGKHRISMVKDVRIFVNTIDHAIRLMTDNGVPATAHREERDGYIEYTVRIPTAAAQK